MDLPNLAAPQEIPTRLCLFNPYASLPHRALRYPDSPSRHHHKCTADSDSKHLSLPLNMSRSSPARRSQLLSSPDRKVASRFLLDDRNNEVSHRDALAAAQLEHDRVRKAAIRVYELHELQIEHQRIVDEERREEERLKTEALIVAEEQRLRELRARTIPRPPPEPPRSPTPPPPVKRVAAANTNGTTPTKESKPPASTTPPSEVKKAAAAPPSSLPNKPPPTNPFQKTNGLAAPQSTATPAAPVAAPTAQPARSPTVDRYSQIHQELKKLRKELQAQSKVAGSPLKGKMGTFRREIRVSIGQLTSGKGANALPVSHPSFDSPATF